MTPAKGELIIGLIGAAGTDLHAIYNMINTISTTMNCQAHYIHLSSAFDQSQADVGEDIRITELMDTFDNLRRTEGADAAAQIATQQIEKIRRMNIHDARNDLFIIRSLKRPEEVSFLRQHYRESFIAASVFLPREARALNLARKIASSYNRTDAEAFRNRANDILLRDEKDRENEYGQNVRDTFAEADIFIDGRNPKQTEKEIRRLLEICLGYPYHTPTRDELGMYFAAAAALRSADLARQVGAVLANDEGDIISTGCNDVPKPG